MATVWPFACKAWTSWRFCSGVTRPKTVHFSAASASAASLCSVAASTQCSAPAMPALAATWLTACGSSPEMTLIFTPCFAKKRNVLGALADAVLQRQQRQKFQLCGVERRGRIRQRAVIFCQQQHAAALGQQRVSLSASSPPCCPPARQAHRRRSTPAHQSLWHCTCTPC